MEYAYRYDDGRVEFDHNAGNGPLSTVGETTYGGIIVAIHMRPRPTTPTDELVEALRQEHAYTWAQWDILISTVREMSWAIEHADEFAGLKDNPEWHRWCEVRKTARAVQEMGR